ncbi:MAG: RNA polymerase sigma factor [Deltaproteobacteria bacterium]|nr:RNA polymerase sigma factor [Deltaproteobacteria bacterium]
MSDVLIKKAQKGDGKAFEKLLQENYALIYRMAYRFSSSQEEAEELTQELCLKLVDKITLFKGESKFSTWLYQLVLNLYRDRIKSQKASRIREEVYDQVLKQKEDLDLKEQKAWLYQSLKKLNPILYETALLVLAEGLSHAEAALVMDCTESTISWRMHEIKQALIRLKDEHHER